MTATHAANSTPKGRKPIKDWAPEAEEKARIEAMLAKCRKHTESKIEASPEAPPPQTIEAPQLCWTRTASHEMTSTCEGYQIRKRMSEEARGITPHWLYECWFKVPGYWYYRIGPAFRSFDEAKGHCEQHRRGKSLK
jgi:hypothetical protein